MKMSEERDKRISHKRFYVVLVLAILLVCLLVEWLIIAAAGITSGFTKNMNTLYLREMTNLTQANFKSGLSLRYSGLRAVAESVNEEDRESLEAHFQTAHFTTIVPKIEKLHTKPSVVNVYEKLY